jgi:hypothetical protein
MTRIFFAALALAGALSVAACAGRPPPPRGAGGPGRAADFSGGLIAQPIGLVMTDLDADGDRSTTRSELDAGMAAFWSELDADGDGKASPFEFADWSRAVMGSDTAIPGRVAFDLDADGVVSRAELVATLLEEFGRLDADHSDAIERAELVRLVESPGMIGPAGGSRTFILRRGQSGQDGGSTSGPLAAR